MSRLKGHAVTDAHARARVERDQVDAKVDLPAAGAVPPQRGHRPGRRRVARARRLAHARSRGGSALSRAGVALSRVGVALSEQVLWERACVRKVSEHARCQDGLGRLCCEVSPVPGERHTHALSRSLGAEPRRVLERAQPKCVLGEGTLGGRGGLYSRQL